MSANEFDLIEAIRRRATTTRDDVLLGIGDDALVVARKNHTAVALTSKTIRELAGTCARVVGTVVNEY